MNIYQNRVIWNNAFSDQYVIHFFRFGGSEGEGGEEGRLLFVKDNDTYYNDNKFQQNEAVSQE